jgi:hypothetical protein
MVSGSWFSSAPDRPAASRTGCARNRPSCRPRPIRRTGNRRSSKFEAVLVDKVQLLARRVARIAGESANFFGSPAAKKQASPAFQAKLQRGSPRCAPADVLGDRAGAFDCAFLRARRCSRAPAGPRPAPRSSSGRRRRGCRRSWPGSPRRDLRVVGEHAGEDLEAGTAKCSVTSCISIGLRRSGLSVPYLRIASS